MSYLKTLNDEQQAVVYETEGPKAVIAGAGSGKSRVIVAKVIHLIQNKNVLPSTIWVCTFTKKAKEELVERLSKELGASTAKKIKIGTLHSISLSIYKNGLMMVDQKSKYSLPKPLVNEGTALFQIFNFIRANEKKIHSRDGKDFLSTIDIRRMYGGTLLNYKKMFPFDMENGRKGWCYNETIYEVWKFYEKWKRQNNWIDFSDMIVLCAEMLENSKYKTYLESLQRSCKYILIDEAQDNNAVNYRIVELLSGLNNNITTVGDARQCQPAGTMVSVTGKGPVDIKDIKVGTEVPAFRRDYSYFSGKNIQGSKITEKGERKFKGKMYTISVGNKETRCTPNHKFFSKWVHTHEEKKNDKRCVVYLMRNSIGKYRVGWCQLFDGNSGTHFFSRCRMEEADGWILKICDSRQDASYCENLISANYGIPLTLFISCRTKIGADSWHHYSQTFLDSIFLEYTNNEIKGEKCLHDYDRDELYPFYSYSRRNEKGKKGRQTIFKIEVCNILPELMTLPLDSDAKEDITHAGKHRARYNAMFTPVDSVSVKYEECLVYSLNVDVNHTYIADGIGTCNCIFSFQGASLENLHGFIKRKNPRIYNLRTNYRSTKTIVDNSNAFIEGSKGIIGEPSIAFKDEGESIKFCTSENTIEEAHAVYNLVNNLVKLRGYKYKDIAILYRVHSQSVMLESCFLSADIPYVTLIKNTFFDKKEIKDIIIYLKSFQNPDSLDFSEFKRIVGRPNRYISSKATKAIESYCMYEDATPWEALNDLNNVGGLDSRNKQCFNEMRNQIISGINKMQIDTSVKDLIQHILTGIGYETWIKEGTKDKTPDGDVIMDFDAIINLVNSFQTLKQFFDYVDKVKEQEAVRKSEKNGDYIQMMTQHAAKGSEFPVVIILGNCTRLAPFHRNEDREEEKRLMYVAITRPEQELYISVIGYKLGRFKVRPSPFLRDFKAPYREDYSGRFY